MEKYVGLDVRTKRTAYCVQNKSGKILKQGWVETVEAAFATLVECLKIPKGTQVALETGAQAKWMAHLLEGLRVP